MAEFIMVGARKVNAASSLVSYFIDDVSVGTISTNIPVANGITNNCLILKTNGNGIRSMVLDYWWHQYILTSTR